MMIFSVWAALAIAACTVSGDGSSIQGAQIETVAPTGKKTFKQMETFDKLHPPHGEKRAMPMPGSVPEQDIDALLQSKKLQSK